VPLIYLLHITAGCIGLISGYTALYSAKGAPLHRKAGMVFVYAMLPMCAMGLTIAVARGVAPAINIPAGLLTASLVITALTTVRPPSPTSYRLNRIAMVTVLLVGVGAIAVALRAIAAGGRESGIAYPLFMFGIVGLLAFKGDVKVMRHGELRGAARLARHLWRMSFALFIAALSFFIGQARVIPEPIRIRPLLALPVLAVLATMFYWMWRVRTKRTARVIVRGGAPEAPPPRSR
jgi:uncharacterized membrane protein